MVEYSNDCVGCPPEMGCIGNLCKHTNVPHWYCDECGAEETLYYVDNQELCGNCALKALEMVEGSDSWF